MQSTYNCIIAHCSVCLSRYDPVNEVLLVWMYVRTCLHTYSHTYSYTYSYTYSHTYSHTCSELSLRILLRNASYVHKPSRYTWQEWVVEGTWKTLRSCHRHSKRVVPARTTRNWIELIETESMKTTCRLQAWRVAITSAGTCNLRPDCISQPTWSVFVEWWLLVTPRMATTPLQIWKAEKWSQDLKQEQNSGIPTG